MIRCFSCMHFIHFLLVKTSLIAVRRASLSAKQAGQLTVLCCVRFGTHPRGKAGGLLKSGSTKTLNTAAERAKLSPTMIMLSCMTTSAQRRAVQNDLDKVRVTTYTRLG
eukprot:2343158-Rhodomonas_salina.4